MDLYIYYRVPAEHTAKLAARILSMQQALTEEYAVAGTLKRRPGEEPNGCQTWMEIYHAAPDGFETVLE
jgi:hypothetical protein